MKSEKIVAVNKLRERFLRARVSILTDFSQMSVREMEILRRKLREKNAELKVVKNLLARRALREAVGEELSELLIGQTAVVFGYDDEVEPVKILFDFQKSQEKLKLKGGLLGRKRIDLKELEKISQMPSQRELYVKIIFSLQSPLFRLLWALKANATKLCLVLKAIGSSGV